MSGSCDENRCSGYNRPVLWNTWFTLTTPRIYHKIRYYYTILTFLGGDLLTETVSEVRDYSHGVKVINMQTLSLGSF